VTYCPAGEHEFPYEDEQEAYCQEHGVRLVRNGPTFLWRGDPITDDDLTTAPGPAGTEE
jgi:hypothetical protein